MRTLPPNRKRETRDRVSGKMVEWGWVDLEEYGFNQAGSRNSADAVESGALVFPRKGEGDALAFTVLLYPLIPEPLTSIV